MNRFCRYQIVFALTTLLLMMPMGKSYAEVGVADLTGEDKVKFERFRELFQHGHPDEFFAYVADYEQDLKKKGFMMLYYKLQNNKGFFALRHNMVYRAMQIAEQLDGELRNAGAKNYYYLATGLLGDVYTACHNRIKAEQYFIQALDEVGDSDPKFTMRCYQSLAESLSLADPDKALDWISKSLILAEETRNTEYYSLSLAIGAYIQFLNNKRDGFYKFYDQYRAMREKDDPDFNYRYDNVMEIARLSFEGEYDKASYQLGHSGTIYVDSSLVAIHIFGMERDVEKSFGAMKRHHFEMDSIYCMSQEANFDQMATERTLMRSREEAKANKMLVKRLISWMIALTVVFLFIYVMGRRRLVKKIWASNKELKAALDKAEESDRVKTAFIKNMSHEIRTPLNAVAGFSQLLCNPEFQVTDEEKANMQKRITSSVDQITGIVNEVLELSKGQSEGVVPDSEKTDVKINELCLDVLHDAKGRQYTGVEIRFSTNVDNNFTFRSNTYRLGSILRHLMDNALKFTERGHILLEVCHDSHKKQMVIKVTDTGIGVAENVRDRIFELFCKGDDFKEGVGLGLPICQRLVNSLGGTVVLDPEYTNGSSFVITLPT